MTVCGSCSKGQHIYHGAGGCRVRIGPGKHCECTHAGEKRHRSPKETVIPSKRREPEEQ